jgi:hypothetical protein
VITGANSNPHKRDLRNDLAREILHCQADLDASRAANPADLNGGKRQMVGFSAGLDEAPSTGGGMSDWGA